MPECNSAMGKPNGRTKKILVKDAFVLNNNHPRSLSKKVAYNKTPIYYKKLCLVETPSFVVQSEDFEPAYMELFRTGELYRRSRVTIKRLENCKVCPRDCKVNRLANKMALCKTGRHAIISSAFPHFSEEDCLRGTNGSGTIFFSMCNLKFVFCQNYNITRKERESR